MAFRESFARDFKSVRDKRLLQRVKGCIEAVERADSLGDLPNLKKLKGVKSYFRLSSAITASASHLKTTLSFLCFPRSQRHLQIFSVRLNRFPRFAARMLASRTKGATVVASV